MNTVQQFLDIRDTAIDLNASPTPRRSDFKMDAPEPDTPFAAVSAQTSKYQQVRWQSNHGVSVVADNCAVLTFEQMYQAYLDKSTPFITYRWVGTGVLFLLFAMRIVFAQGWYIGKNAFGHVGMDSR